MCMLFNVCPDTAFEWMLKLSLLEKSHFHNGPIRDRFGKMLDLLKDPLPFFFPFYLKIELFVICFILKQGLPQFFFI